MNTPSSASGSPSIAELQAALQASEQRAAAIVETAVNPIITIDENCIIETVNTATEKLFGYKRHEMVGQNISMLMPQPFRDRHDGYVEHYMRTGERRIIGIGREALAMRKDGSVFPIDLSVGEALLPTGRRIFTGIIRDISERKSLEDKVLNISEEERARIGRDLHDDLCQQLAAIGCLAKVAQQRLAHIGSEEAAHLGEIVRMVSEANTRARETARGLMPMVHDSGGLMDALKELASSTARAFGIQCEFRFDNPVKVQDIQTALQLFRVAQEAVSNAVKHSQATRVEIHLARQSGNIVLTVRDNGVGIPDQGSKGTGMGLLTMSHRAQMMGGAVSFSSRPHGGTQVTCSVPAPTPNPKS